MLRTSGYGTRCGGGSRRNRRLLHRVAARRQLVLDPLGDAFLDLLLAASAQFVDACRLGLLQVESVDRLREAQVAVDAVRSPDAISLRIFSSRSSRFSSWRCHRVLAI